MNFIRSLAAAAALSISVLAAPGLAQAPDPAALMMTQEPTVIGDLTIMQAWARATPPGAPTAAGYLTITNNGTAGERLLGVSSAIFGTAEIHEMIMADNRMMMRPLEDGLTIAAGETVVLQPGGFHLMFMGIGDGLAEGTTVEVTLIFASAGEVIVTLVVYPIGSPGPAGAGGGLGAMGM